MSPCGEVCLFGMSKWKSGLRSEGSQQGGRCNRPIVSVDL